MKIKKNIEYIERDGDDGDDDMFKLVKYLFVDL